MFVGVDVDLGLFEAGDGSERMLVAEGIRERADFMLYVPEWRRLYVLTNDGGAALLGDGDPEGEMSRPVDRPLHGASSWGTPMIYTATWTQFGVLAVALIGLVALGGYIAQRRSGGTDRAEAVQRVAGMQRVGRVIYWGIGVLAVLIGLVTSEPVAVLFGIASLIAGTGQHWAYRRSTRR